MKRFLLPALLTLTILILTACAPSQAGASSPSGTSQSGSSGASADGSADLTRSDGQGMITVDVTPLNLSNPSDNLIFEVAMNTHSVDLSMNLATLATLTTDTGITVQAISWDGPSGGHHVDGKLAFPAMKDGKSILDGTSKLTLTIINVGAPSRVFVWQLK
jgi:hypothetical protein